MTVPYIDLFNLAYSTTISESVKDEIISQINLPVTESALEFPEDIYESIVFLDKMACSGISEGVVNEIIDKVFEGCSEEYLEEVYEAYIRAKALAYVCEDAAPIGLAGIKRENARREEAQKRAEEKRQARAEAIGKFKEGAKRAGQEVLGKIKGAVGKVKNWYKTNYDRPIGLARINNFKAQNKPIEAPKPEVKAETPKPEPKVEAPKAEVKVKTPKPEPKVETPKSEVKEPKKNAKSKEVIDKAIEAPKPEVKEEPAIKAEVKAETPKSEPKVEAPKAEVKKSKKNAKSKEAVDKAIETPEPEVKEEPAAKAEDKPAKKRGRPKKVKAEVNSKIEASTNKEDTAQSNTAVIEKPKEKVETKDNIATGTSTDKEAPIKGGSKEAISTAVEAPAEGGKDKPKAKAKKTKEEKDRDYWLRFIRSERAKMLKKAKSQEEIDKINTDYENTKKTFSAPKQEKTKEVSKK